MRVKFPLALAAGLLASATAAAADPSYAKEVRPFLVKYCVECHTAKQAKAGFNFDTFAGLTKVVGKNGAAVVPGDAAKSLLTKVLNGTGKVMPPKKYPEQPKKDEIDVVLAWLRAGGKED
jgi:mono/diheme cytochrome c family protein